MTTAQEVQAKREAIEATQPRCHQCGARPYWTVIPYAVGPAGTMLHRWQCCGARFGGFTALVA